MSKKQSILFSENILCDCFEKCLNKNYLLFVTYCPQPEERGQSVNLTIDMGIQTNLIIGQDEGLQALQ